jgi:hypothetical protein
MWMLSQPEQSGPRKHQMHELEMIARQLVAPGNDLLAADRPSDD